MENCSACGSEIDDLNSVFCPECGSNVKIEYKVMESVSSLKSGVSSGSGIKEQYIQKYKTLTDKILELRNVDEILHQQEMYLKNISVERDNARKTFNQIKFLTGKEQKDVDDLNKLTWTSIKARVKGDRETMLEKEEAELFEALNKQAGVENDLQTLENRVTQAQNQYLQIKEQYDYKQSLIQERLNLVHQACEGVKDPIEDKIEAEIAQLISQRNPIIRAKQKLDIVRDHINSANRHFESAISLLDSAKSAANWDTFMGGGFFADSVKHSRMADARNSLQQAYRSLQMAYSTYPSLPRVQSINIEQGSFFWDTMFDNFFSDMRAREKIQRALRDVRTVRNQMNAPLRQIQNEIRQYHVQDVNLYNAITEKQEDLSRERMRMMNEAVN